MEAVLFQIVRALATVFEITLAFALLNAMFEPKYASKWPLRLSYILLLAAVFSSSARLTVISVKTAGVVFVPDWGYPASAFRDRFA